MTNINIEKDEYIMHSGGEVDSLCLLLKGQAEHIVGQTRLVLGPGSVLGLSDAFHGKYFGDYRAISDCTVTRIDYYEYSDFDAIFDQMPVYIFGFMKNALRQCRNLFEICLDSKYLAEDFYMVATEKYREYLHLCNEKKMPYKRFTRINYITEPKFSVNVSDWEHNYVVALNDIPNEEIEQVYGSNKAVAVGVIGNLCRMMDKAIKVLDEIAAWIEKNMDIILAESKMDLFQLWFDMKARACVLGRRIQDIDEAIDNIHEFIMMANIYPPELVEKKWKTYLSYDFANPPSLNGQITGIFVDEEIHEDVKKEGVTFAIEDEFEQLIDNEFGDVQVEVTQGNGEEAEDCLDTISEFAGLAEKSSAEFRKQIKTYGALTQKDAGDDRTRKLRRAITEEFYTIYQACFFRSLKEENINPIVEMFLHFGFLDVGLIGGQYTDEIYELVGRLPLIAGDGIYTIYTWLKAIYFKEREPSRNELDLDFKGYVQQEKRAGNIREAEAKAMLEDPEERVKFEMANFFRAGNRATSGRMSAFCPPLVKEDFLNSPTSTLLTISTIKKNLDKIRDIDFSIFCRDVYFSEPDKGVKAETLKAEVLPDIILMPNAGIRGMLWQECAGVKKDTPARFILPIFCQVDLYKLLVYTCGAFRWEICRKEQGARWNDIGTDCLTSGFYDYFTFYKKNRELSAEGKEKIRNLLKKNRNSMREAFTAQYSIWLNFESSGNVRLNKIEREIFAKFVPFRKPYRTALSGHPMFQDVVSRYDGKCAQKVKHITQLYAKYEKSGGVIDDALKFNLEFYKS